MVRLYRALWVFGAVLALVGVDMIYPGLWPRQQVDDQWIRINVSDTTTIRIPGGDMTVDLTDPEGVRIISQDWVTWDEFRGLVAQLDRETSINLWPILIESGLILAVLILLGTIVRYITETALIRMVDEAEGTGRRLSVWEGLRRGWSKRAGRLFLLDLAVTLLAILVSLVVFGLAVVPTLLAIGSHEVILTIAVVGSFILLFLAVWLWLAVIAVLSLVMQTARRACVLEELSLMASFRQGVLLTRHHLKGVVPLWLFWMGVRLLWFPIGVAIFFLLTPVLLLTMLIGAALSGVPAALVAAITALFTSGATPWIMGALAGLPILIIVAIIPMLFVNGLVEIYMSSIWTLAYRDLKAFESTVHAPASQAPLMPARTPAD